MPLLDVVCFSTGAAETDKAKARIAVWKVDFMFIDDLLKRSECDYFDSNAERMFATRSTVSFVKNERSAQAARRINDENEKQKMDDDILRMQEPWAIGHPEEGILYIDKIDHGGFHVVGV